MKKLLMAGAALAAFGPARAFADLNFDANTVVPDTGFETVPPGWYNVAIDESEIKPTKDGLGSYLELRFNILDGQYANRKLYTRLNIKNVNAQTVEIAYKQLSAICHAVNILNVQNSSQLHGIPLKGKVKIRKGSGDYEDSNEFTAYKNINEVTDTPGATPSADAPAQPWTTGATAAMATGAAPTEQPAQPWAQPQTAAAPAAEAAPAPAAAAPAPAPVATHDPIAAAEADGWIKHPSAPGQHYKGNESKFDADFATMYPAPVAAAAPPPVAAAPVAATPTPAAAPAPTASPSEPAAAAAQAAPPPWATPAA